MKQLTCEMCGSTDVIKQDGVFVCQSCGCKYSVEEAKKLLIEVDGVIEVAGTVKVDTSDELSNLYQIARRAKDDNNSENAAKYYDMILVKDPTSWEASFYVVYFNAITCKIAQIQSAAISVANCIDTVLKLVKDHVSKRDEQIKAVQDVALRCTSISDLLYDAAKKHYFGIHSDIRYKYGSEMYDRCCAARDIMYILGNNVDSIFSDCTELHSTAIAAWKNGITKNKDLIGYLGRRDTRNANKKIVADYEAKIQKATHAIAAEKAKKERLAKEAYWAEHAEEKADLENEKATLNKQIKALNDSLNEQFDSLIREKQAVPGKEELDNFNARIQELNEEKNSLGLFKAKEKKALQEQIDKVEADKKTIQTRMNHAKKEIDTKIEAVQKETNKKISALRNRIISINEELTKER